MNQQPNAPLSLGLASYGIHSQVNAKPVVILNEASTTQERLTFCAVEIAHLRMLAEVFSCHDNDTVCQAAAVFYDRLEPLHVLLERLVSELAPHTMGRA